jgi:hypothetical protein
MGALKLTTASSGSVILNPANTASDVTITVPAVTGTMLTNKTAGTVLQVVQGTYATQVSTTSTTYTDTGLTASITPSSTSSKILVIVSQPMQVLGAVADIDGGFILVRDSTKIYDPNQADPTGPYGIMWQGANTGTTYYLGLSQNMSYVDSPSTTSSITYKTQMRVYTTSRTIKAQPNGGSQSGTATIILMEIAG